MNRRSLFGFLAAAPVGVIPAALAEARKNDGPAENESSSLEFYERGFPEPKMRLRVTVGQDNHLWIKSEGGEWKRVKAE